MAQRFRRSKSRAQGASSTGTPTSRNCTYQLSNSGYTGYLAVLFRDFRSNARHFVSYSGSCAPPLIQ